MDPQSKVPRILNWILLLVCVTIIPIQAMESRKLDEVKCAPCGDTPSTPSVVYYSPPPPIVYPSPPPPPPIVYYSPPPPSPKKTPSAYCPPPPSSSSSPPYQYITGPPGPPGNLYPVDENFSGATTDRRRSFATFLPLFVGLLSLLAFW